jgi:aspartate aminotransferase-like enzyme
LDRAKAEDLRLFTPGPVDLSSQARNGLAMPVEHHRTESFESLLLRMLEDLKQAFRTSDEVVALTSSGTGAMESVVASLFSPGDRVLVPVSGKFSRRWAGICSAFGVEVAEMSLEPGTGPSAEAIRERLTEDSRIEAVLLTHSETSTGSLTDLECLGPLIRDVGLEQGREILCCADCISSLCVDELRKDDWFVDCAVSASQKGLLAPPGLAFVCLNQRALGRIEASGRSGYYFDLGRYYRDPSRSPFTPSVSIARAVHDSLEHLLALGLDNVVEANRSGAAGLRMIVEHAGLRPVAREQSNAVIAFWVDDVDPERVAAILLADHGIVVAQGQEELQGRILRASSIGKGKADIVGFGRALEATMAGLGRRFTLDDIIQDLETTLEGSRLWESRQ